MLQRFKAAGLVWPLVATLLGIGLMLGLGSWQMQRLAWKEGLVGAIEIRTQSEPVALAEALRRWKAGEDVEYLRVKAQGRFLHDSELFFYAPSAEEGTGYHVYTPMVVFDSVAGAVGEPPQLTAAHIMVNRGFVPERFKDQAARKEGLVNDQPIEIPAETYHQGSIRGASVVGLLRNPEVKGAFTPDNDLKANLWFWRDLEAMSKALSPGNCKSGDRSKTFCGYPGYPFFLDLEAGAVPGGWPRGGVTLVKLPNRHLEYAITWFGLAATLATVFAAFAAQRLRGSGPANGS